MEYKEIVSVTGLGGLFQLLSSKSDGAIVRSLDDNVTRFVPTRTHNFTPLESIEVFTNGENVTLAEVLKAMRDKEAEHPIPDAVESKAIKAYFQKVYPDLDETRVYVSDMKKMLKWYPVLKTHDLLKFEEPASELGAEEATEPTPSPEAITEETKPAKKAKQAKASKKEASSDETKSSETVKEEAKKKKPTAKKKKDEG